MTVGESSCQHVRLAENIAVLSVLDALPGESSDNSPPSSVSNEDPRRTLSFEREQFLASGLACLAEISDNPNHIVAVAVEERPFTQGLAVLVAINKEHATSAEGPLEQVKKGLQAIFSVLAEIEHDSNPRLEHKVLRAIIHLCGKRILLRLGSPRVRPHNPLRAPSYLGNALSDVTNALLAWKRRRMVAVQDRPLVDSFVASSKKLRLLVRELDSCSETDVDRNLEDVVSMARQINKLQRLPALLRSIHGRHLNPTARDGLLARLGELARYHDFSQHLHQTAKNISLLRNVEVISVTLDDACFSRATYTRNFSSIDACLARCVHGRRDTARLCQNRGMTISEATHKVRARARDVMTESKIHAEIQIAAYYEISPATMPPRVICSNKDACYLCNEFMRLLGKFYMPGCHGRLYHGWRVPSLSVFDKTLSQLNQTLESKIGAFYRTNVHANRRRPPAQNWTERAVIRFSNSMSTLASMPSRSPSLESISQDFTNGNSRPGPGNATEPLSSPRLPLQIIAEIPPRSPTAESSAESDASTVRATSRTGKRLVVDGRADSLSDQPEDATLNDLDKRPQENTTQHAVDDEESIMTNGGASDDIEETNISQTTLGGGSHTGIPTTDDSPDATAGSGEEASRSRSESQPSQEAPSVNELTENTSPEEEDPESSERGKDKHKAEAGVQARAQHPDYGSSHSPIMLTKGVAVNCQLANNRYPPCYTAGLLTIIPEFVPRHGSTGTTTACGLDVEWLADDEAREATSTRRNVTDVQAMDEAADVDAGSSDCVLLEHGGIVIRINVTRS